MKQKPTIQDVAKLADVSTATVSRFLNDTKTLRPSMQARVAKAIDQLGYTPNFGARALASRKSHIIGAIIPTMDNAIFATAIQTFQEVLASYGFSLLISSSAYVRKTEEVQIYDLISRGVEGLLLIGLDRDPKIYDFLKHRQIPYILAWNYRANNDHYYVGFDNKAAAAMAAQKAIDFGHKNFAIITGYRNENDRARERLQGYLQAIHKEGLTISDEAIKECEYSFEAASHAFEDIWQKTKQITALLCGNDVLAVGALNRAKELGLKVPDDLSVIGFDDIDITRIVTPTLSTIHIPHRQMGHHAAQLMNMLLNEEGQNTAVSICLTPHFVLRDSLAKPAIKNNKF